MIERTLVLLKPDSVQRSICGEIITRFEKATLKIVGMKLVHASEDLVNQHYADDEDWYMSVGKKAKAGYVKLGKTSDETEREIGVRIRNQLKSYLSMSPTIAIVFEGHGAINKVRAITGDTAPLFSAPGTIRGDFSIDSYALADKANRPIQNLIHASDAPETAAREIKLWFSESELYQYPRVDEELIYRMVE
ncbi:nucleoside-diphosphate kinase [archaeon]|jgi:nucleoside-diphosphate kinase|nr:nucleoside-diphosphate kinase [archaeon]|tara:strand:+ start:1137 stop:1712 length:576 start_codon:yes stop_codon:yes gene_type:complete